MGLTHKMHWQGGGGSGSGSWQDNAGELDLRSSVVHFELMWLSLWFRRDRDMLFTSQTAASGS